ncbi:MAG: hypothetical protein ABI625_14875 [bacterium]
MTLNPAIRRMLLAIAVLLLLGLTWTGLTGGVHQWPVSQSPGQRAQTVTQLAYGLFAILSVVTTFAFQRWAPVMIAGFAISAALAAGLASIVWGETSVATGLVSGGAALLLALGIAWLLRVGARDARAPVASSDRIV